MPQTQEHREVQEVVRAHAGWVFACAKGRVRDDALAEDVAQAVFILFWQKRERLGGEAKVTGWLYRAVRYCAGNALRLKRVRQRHEREAAMARLADASGFVFCPSFSGDPNRDIAYPGRCLVRAARQQCR